MADELLSQTDIDSLLEELKTGSAPDGISADFSGVGTRYKIKTYDFRRQTRFAKDQIRTLSHIHENFSRSVTTFFSTQLRYMVNMSVVSVDQPTYGEYIQAVSNPALLAIFNLGALEGKAILDIDLDLAFSILDRLLGGLGNSKQEKRKLTDIEEAIMSKVVQRILQELNEAWSGIIPLEPQFSMFESNPHFTQIAPRNDMMLLVSFDVSISGVDGMMSLCIPCFSLEPVAGKLSDAKWISSQRKDGMDENTALLTAKISELETEIRVELGKSAVTYGELLQLDVGDVLRLTSKPNEELSLFVGNEVKFKGLPGISGRKMALTITKTVQDRGV
jgi:flagellar motor switch protein FliM